MTRQELKAAVEAAKLDVAAARHAPSRPARERATSGRWSMVIFGAAITHACLAWIGL